jgi:Ca-activated chloride channel family protein
MPRSRATLPAALPLLAATLLLAACSAPQQLQVDSAAAPPPPPAPGKRVEMTGSAISSYSGYAGVPPSTFQRRLATMPYPMPQYAPGAERFPDAQANRAVLVEEQPVSSIPPRMPTCGAS